MGMAFMDFKPAGISAWTLHERQVRRRFSRLSLEIGASGDTGPTAEVYCPFFFSLNSAGQELPQLRRPLFFKHRALQVDPADRYRDNPAADGRADWLAGAEIDRPMEDANSWPASRRPNLQSWTCGQPASCRDKSFVLT